MSVEAQRDLVLERIYDRLLNEYELDEFFDNSPQYSPDGKRVVKQQPPVAQLIATLESSRVAEMEAHQKEVSSEREAALKEQELALKKEELRLRDDVALTDNAQRDMDRKQQTHAEMLRAAVTVGTSVLTTAVWGVIFVHEMKQTRLFEVEGTEVSAAGRWLKSSFPKPRFL